MSVGAKLKRLRFHLKRGRAKIAKILGYNERRRKAIKRLESEWHHVGVMFDDTDLSQIPANAPAVAGYTSGNWPTYWELAKRFPHAWKLSIAVSASHDADCLDVEAGDASPEQASAWVKRQIARGVKRPVVYCSVSGMDSLLELLAGAGISRDQVRVWTAHYTFAAHRCGPHSCGALSATTADATQWTDQALGRVLDESLLTDGFFR